MHALVQIRGLSAGDELQRCRDEPWGLGGWQDDREQTACPCVQEGQYWPSWGALKRKWPVG